MLFRLNLDINKLNNKILHIRIGNNESSKPIVCYEIMLLVKLRKIFDSKTFNDKSLVSVKDIFYVYNCGQSMVISYPLLTEIHQCNDLDDLLLSEHVSSESPEEKEEEIIDLAFIGTMFEDQPKLEFNIDENFPLKNTG